MKNCQFEYYSSFWIDAYILISGIVAALFYILSRIHFHRKAIDSSIMVCVHMKYWPVWDGKMFFLSFCKVIMYVGQGDQYFSRILQ